jgi:uncharacterized protein YkwD
MKSSPGAEGGEEDRLKEFRMILPSVKAMMLRAGAIFLLLGMLAACAPKPAPQAPPVPPAAPPEPSAEAFFAQEITGRPIDPQKVDQVLLAAALFHETNRVRQKNGRPPLGRDARLEAAARMHADDMARQGFLSHENPYRADRRTPRDRALRAGFHFRFLAENVATQFSIQYQSGRTVYRVPTGTGFSYQPDGPPLPRHTYRTFAATVLDQWMHSSGHRENILSSEPQRFGSDCRLRKEKDGLDQFYCVQLFGTAGGEN